MAERSPRQLIEHLEVLPADADGLRSVLAACAALTGWVESRRLAAINALAALGVVAEHAAAEAARTSLAQGSRDYDRARAAAALPEMTAGLADGELTIAHLDITRDALKQVPDDRRDDFVAQAGDLAAIAKVASIGEFRTAVANRVRLLQHDGNDRLARQRTACRFDIRTGNDGMVNGRFSLDPESGMVVSAAVQAVVERLFHSTVPEHCPTDPFDKQSFLRSQALVALVTNAAASGNGASAVGVRVNIHIDERTLHDGPHEATHIDTGGADVPVDTIRRWVCDSPIRRVILGSRGEPLDLGRDTRLASVAQRTALRAIFPTCFVPGCDTPFSRCQVHHINPYAAGGRTDLTDLRPVCHAHHHSLHEGGWVITQHDGWQLTIVRPGAAALATGPPSARAG